MKIKPSYLRQSNYRPGLLITMWLLISYSVLCGVYATLFRDYLVKQKFAKLIVSDAPATKLRHAVRRTAHASRDGERRPHATETGKLYRLPTETKNVYVVLSAVHERLCLCLQPEHTHTHTHTHTPSLSSWKPPAVSLQQYSILLNLTSTGVPGNHKFCSLHDKYQILDDQGYDSGQERETAHLQNA
jgi:hypothetical protein